MAARKKAKNVARARIAMLHPVVNADRNGLTDAPQLFNGRAVGSLEGLNEPASAERWLTAALRTELARLASV